jgi:hypothetical protein
LSHRALTPPVNSFWELTLCELKEIKKDLESYTENLDQYIQAFRELSQNLKLSQKDVMILLSQTLTSLVKQQILD